MLVGEIIFMTGSEQDPIREMLAQRLELQRYLIAKSWDDEEFKQELLSNPKAVLSRELEQDLPDNVKVQVIEGDADTIYLSIPPKPTEEASIEEELSDEALDAIAGGAGAAITVVGAVGDERSAFGSLYRQLNPSVVNKLQRFAFDSKFGRY